MTRAQRRPTRIPYFQTAYINFDMRAFLPGYELDSGDIVTYSLVNTGRSNNVTLVNANTGEINYRSSVAGNDDIAYTIADAYTISEPFTLTMQVLNEVPVSAIALQSQESLPPVWSAPMLFVGLMLLTLVGVGYRKRIV